MGNIPPAITFAPSKDQENLSQNFSNPMPKPSSPTKIMVPLRRTVSDIPHRPSPLASISRLQRSSCGNLEIHPPILPITKRDASGEFVSTSTVAELIEGKYPHLKFVIIDCRFKFEFDGGHIKNAETIIPSQLEDKLSDIFFKEPVPPTNPNLVVFSIVNLVPNVVLKLAKLFVKWIDLQIDQIIQNYLTHMLILWKEDIKTSIEIFLIAVMVVMLK